METRIEHHTEQFVHDISSSVGLCPEMLEVAEEACRAGDFDLAAEIYGSQLSDLPQPDRGLCLRKADALTRSGRIAEALDSYCTAASLKRLQPEELGLLVENIAQNLREKEHAVLGKELKSQKSETSNAEEKEIKTNFTPSGDGDSECEGDASEDEQSLDLFSCRLCKCLLLEPTTLQCGHTFCKRCLENDGANVCKICKNKLNIKNGQVHPVGFRVNVVLCSLLEKWFASEGNARRCWLEGESMWKNQDFASALEKYNKAAELAPSDCRLMSQRAELHMHMKNFTQALLDGDSMCRLDPLWPKAHYMKATALSKVGRKEEALQEYLLCVALKPAWTSARMEAQKILSEMFSSVFERDGLPAPLHPIQTGPSSTRLKPSSLQSFLQHPTDSPSVRAGSSRDPVFAVTKSTPCNGLSELGHLEPLTSGSSLSKLEFPFDDTKTLASILSGLPTTPSLKRKCPTDCSDFSPPSKYFKSDTTCSSQKPATMTEGREVPPELLDSGDMECSLCMRLFYEPVTTPCGHTFCLKCLERCLDHNPTCPLCKENLSEYIATRGYTKTHLMEEVLQRYMSEELAERKKIHEEELKELSNLNQEVPIFICTMAFPTIPCPLHVFEPRYRLMIRRSMETGTKQFGMCITDELKGFADYGCMLEVRDVKFFPDGRSVVDTIGVARFRVLSHGQRDGYNTAKIEYLEDKKVEGEELADLLKLHDSVYGQATAWFTSLKENMRNQILSHFGNLPGKDPDPQGSPSGPAWCWWLLAVLPLESRAQLSILAMTSLKDRLIAIRRVLIFVTRKRARCP
ncbi:LON peptidase N-terminal domain and RING finger protein 2-like [Megalops cyprinoides]|uniref:LON peptidase N-terminal domain and RING finger protein 2-like n=1 Tax=Megalops cyprinoides TaxID=118141 RepID=UPI001863AABE|nr:LON peptidase N-terminal domain and RING finger protein 2-like [Megalops cyprinoides]XP_036396836.1 LON peptidase N-terminal domain and RING finger protein 2-like [Megalops cyprinoides]